MSDPVVSCATLAATLAAAPDPAPLIPDRLPCSPLELLIALHQEVTRTMLADLAHAARAAAAAWAVARRFPADPLVQAQAQWSQGSAILYVPDYARSLGHYDAALAWYDRACQLLAPDTPAHDVRIVQIVRVGCLIELGRYAEAQQAVAMAERWLQEHPHEYGSLTLLLNRSFLAGSMGDYTQMVALADATVALALRLDQPARVAQGWINRAYACIYLGRFSEAEEALDRGIDAAARAGEPVTIARAQWNRARLLRCQGRLFDALTVLREAERGLAQAEGEAATIATEAAVIYERLRQLPEARRAARFAAERFAQQSMPTYSAGAGLQAIRISIQQGQASAARKLLDGVKAQARLAQLPVLDAELALAEASLATLPMPTAAPRTLARRRGAARGAANQAITIFQTSGLVQQAAEGQLTVAALDAQLGDTTTALAAYRRLAQHGDRQVQLAACAELGALLPPAVALPYLRRAAGLALELRRALPMEELQARYSGETSPYHLRLAACHLALGAVELAIESVWSAKAGPLIDLRAAAAPLDSATLVELEGAKTNIARWREQEHEHRRKAVSAARQGQLESATFHTRRAEAAAADLYAAEQRLTAAMRTLGDRGGQARVPTLEEVEQALTPGMALLEYAVCGDDLFSFFVRPDQPVAYQSLADARALAPLLDRWNLVAHRLIEDQASPNAHQQIQAVLAPLWDILVAPWRASLAAITDLLIAPCGTLHHVPWALLSDATAFLGDSVTLTLTPCGAMWAAPYQIDLPGSAGQIGPARILGYAGGGARRLDHVAAEIAAITRHLPNAQVSTEATAADLRALPPPRLLHIAAHGLTNPAAPICSTIELADGPFLLLEAHRLDLRGTRLVALSACETSVRPDHGDMALALAGAFLCAGAQAVLASLWAVSDAVTALLMEHFYAALAGGSHPAAALRQAQRQVRGAHPLDWAAFQLWAGAHDRP